MNRDIRPSGKLYGVTHDPDGRPRIVEPKTIKVGIGLAKGKAIHAYIDMAGKWVVMTGDGRNLRRERFDTKQEAQKRYRELKPASPERQYPQRLPYFTFTHVSPDGDFEPDWDVIDSHGPVPTEIDIIFLRDDPFSASYQLWTATEKKCEGDGINALRVNSMAESKAEKILARQAADRGEKYFPVINGCWLRGCPYAKTDGKAAGCRPMGRLLFQLLNSPRLGGTAVFMTSGYRSIRQIFSSIEIFKRTTGCGDADKGFVAGIPLKMVLRPYKVVHDGRAATQYGVSLELRAESAQALKQTLFEHGVRYRLAGREYLKQLEGVVEVAARAEEPDPEDIPAVIAAEFDIDHEQDSPPTVPAFDGETTEEPEAESQDAGNQCGSEKAEIGRGQKE